MPDRKPDWLQKPPGVRAVLESGFIFGSIYGLVSIVAFRALWSFSRDHVRFFTRANVPHHPHDWQVWLVALSVYLAVNSAVILQWLSGRPRTRLRFIALTGGCAAFGAGALLQTIAEAAGVDHTPWAWALVAGLGLCAAALWIYKTRHPHH
jgi:O-antigen/teichoic acid export membrane protein